jgi:hypothetical protein
MSWRHVLKHEFNLAFEDSIGQHSQTVISSIIIIIKQQLQRHEVRNTKN